jgi:hypothetical protein
MSIQHDTPKVLEYAATEMEAAFLVATLREAGIDAQAEGVLTSALRAEAPGEVGILVRESDLERARQVLTEWRDKGDCRPA